MAAKRTRENEKHIAAEKRRLEEGKKNLLRKSVLRIGDGKKKKRLIRLTKLRKTAKTWIAMLLMESFYRKKDQWKRLLRKNRSKEIRSVAEKEAKEKQLEAEQNFASKRRMKEERRAADEKAAKGKRIEQERIYVERKRFEEKRIAAETVAKEKHLEEERIGTNPF